MSDQRLRRLEREVAASPSPESEAALLRERLRAGTLSLERLELAAYCGHEGARAVLSPFPPDMTTASGEDTACLPCVAADRRNYTFNTEGYWHCLRHATEHPDLPMWVAGLSRWGPAVQVRAAVAAARAALPEWMGDRGWYLLGRVPGGLPGDGLAHVSHRERPPEEWGPIESVVGAVEAAERWLTDPNEGNRIDAARAFLAARPVDAGLQFRWLPMVPTRYQAGTHPTPEGGGWGEEPPYPGPSLWHPGEIMAAAELAGEAPVRAAIQSALTSWALGSHGSAQKFNPSTGKMSDGGAGPGGRLTRKPSFSRN